MLHVTRIPAAVALWVLLSLAFCAPLEASKRLDFGTTGAIDVSRSRPLSTASLQSTTTTIVNTPVSTDLYDQSNAVLVPDGGGGLIAVWADTRAGNTDIYAQKLNGGDTPQWAAGGIPVCKAAGNQTNPRAISDNAGGVIVVWQDDRGANTDIYAQRVTSIGTASWAVDGVLVCGASNAQRDPVAAANGFGGVLIAWVDQRGADADVYAQRLNATGVAQWTANGVGLCTATGTQDALTIVPDDLGGAIVGWRDARSGGLDLFARQVTELGSPQWALDGVAVCNASGDQEDLSSIADGSGGAIFAWADKRGGEYDIFAQRLNGTGVAQWIANGATLCTAAGAQRSPALCSDGASGAVAAWEDRRGADADLYAARVTSTGTVPWLADGVVVSSAPGDQCAPTIAADPMGGAVLAWCDGRSAVTGDDVFTQRVLLDGSSYWNANGVQLCDAANRQDVPRILASGLGGAAVLWRDLRGGSYTDLYAQRVDPSGMVPDQCVAPDTLASNLPASTAALQNYRTFNQSNFYWAGAGVQGSSGDWDIEVFLPGGYGLEPYPTCFAWPMAGSYRSSGVDFVMSNFNDNHTPPGKYGVRAFRSGGSGTANIEWDDGQDQMQLADAGNPNNGITSPPGWTGPLDVWDVPLTAGNTYTVKLTHSGAGDIKVLLFSSYGAPGYVYVVPRSASVLEVAGQFGFYTAPSTDYYGVAIVNDNGVPDQYTVQVWSTTPVGAGEGPLFTTSLRGVAPNPSSGAMQIHFAMREAGQASFEIYDMAGRVVSRVPTQRWEAGNWSIPWDGRGSGRQPLSPGVYFVRMSVNGRSIGTARLALIR